MLDSENDGRGENQTVQAVQARLIVETCYVCGQCAMLKLVERGGEQVVNGVNVDGGR